MAMTKEEKLRLKKENADKKKKKAALAKKNRKGKKPEKAKKIEGNQLSKKDKVSAMGDTIVDLYGKVERRRTIVKVLVVFIVLALFVGAFFIGQFFTLPQGAEAEGYLNTGIPILLGSVFSIACVCFYILIHSNLIERKINERAEYYSFKVRHLETLKLSKTHENFLLTNLKEKK